MTTVRLLAVTLFAGFTAHVASAHVSIENDKAGVGTSFKAAFKIPHGCKQSPTTKVTVTIPEGIIGVKPMVKPGWTISVTKGDYARAYDFYHGMKLKEGVKEVVWSGGSLESDFYDEFTIVGFVSDAFHAGDTVYFPTRQDCPDGQLIWSEVPPQGKSAHDLEAPAPSLQIVAGEDEHAHHGAPSAGPINAQAAWARATPAGAAVAAAYLTIKNSGAVADRLLSIEVDVAGRAEIHEMAKDGDVMRMREVPNGLDVPAGGSVTLAPGGLHLMFKDLKGPLVEGQSVKGMLKFEKAGSIPIEFRIEAVGASGPGEHSHH